MAFERAQSWWWCRRCHAFVDLQDPGDPYPQCEECHSRHVELRSYSDGAIEDKPVDKRAIAGFVRRVEQAAPKMFSERAAHVRVKKHLPSDKKDLRTLSKTGYWFCYADDCRQITERNEMGECVCCGAALNEEHNWNKPVFAETEEKAA